MTPTKTRRFGEVVLMKTTRGAKNCDVVDDDDDEEAYLDATTITMVTITSLEAMMSMTAFSLKPRMLITVTLEATTMMMVSLEEKMEALKKTNYHR